MQGIAPGSLCAFSRQFPTLSPGAVWVAMYQDHAQLCAYKTNNGHTGIGISAYLGSNPENFSGLFGRVIVNAGRWLISGPCQTPTPTPTVSPTSTATATVTPTPTATHLYTDRYAHGHSNSYAHADSYTYGHCNCYSYANSNTYFDAETFTNAETGANA